MGEALAEAQHGAGPRRAPDRRRRRRRRGDGRPGPRPRPGDRTTRPPTPSSSPCARPPASSARIRLADATIFATLEPCAMCVGALLESDVEALVFAVAEHPRRRRRHGHPARPAPVACRAGSRSSAGSAATRPRRCFATARRRADAEPLGVGSARSALWYPLPRRGVRVVDGAALEKRCAKAPRVRIPPSPPATSSRTGRPRLPAGSVPSGERSPSGLWRRTGNAVRGNPSRVRIPPSPPHRSATSGAVDHSDTSSAG